MGTLLIVGDNRPHSSCPMTDAIAKVASRIAQACTRAGRTPGCVTIIAVTKTRGIEQIRGVINAGITDIGESRLPEALLKYDELCALRRVRSVRWHLIGHLQTNKVKDAVRIFDLIQSVDSLRLAEAIDAQAAKINKVQDILIEVKTSGEATKFGFLPAEAASIVEAVGRLNNIRVRGLMTIAPVVDIPEKARPYFRLLKKLQGDIEHLRIPSSSLQTLSMGMTDDFEVAIEEGATMVRLGRAIFD